LRVSVPFNRKAVVMVLPFERDHPPIDPPAGCVNRLMWQLGRRLFADHQPGPDGFCQVCRPFQFYPCVGRQLADLGMASAFEAPHGSPWRTALPRRCSVPGL